MHKTLWQRKVIEKYPFHASHLNEVQKTNWYQTDLDILVLQQLHTTQFLYYVHSTEQGSDQVFCFVLLVFAGGGLLLEFFQAHFIEYSDHCISSIVSDLLDGLSPSSHYIWGMHLSAGGKLAIMCLMWANLYRDGIRKSDKPRHKDLFVGNTE